MGSRAAIAVSKGPKDHRNVRILHAIISGLPVVLGLRARLQDPCVVLGP